MRRWVAVLGFAVSAGLYGCDFQLAGTHGAASHIPYKFLQIEGGTPEFRQQLSRTLASIEVAAVKQNPDLIVHLQGPAEREQVIAVTTDMDAREYEIGMHLSVQLQKPKAERSEAVHFSRYRHWVFDTDRYLAADEERQVLTQEMRHELIEALLMHIQTQAE